MTSPAFLRLPVESSETRSVLFGGEWNGKLALPVSAGSAGYGLPEEVCFELIERAAVKEPGFAMKWFLIVRAYSLTATAMPCLAALLYGFASGWDANILSAMGAFFGALLLQVAINVLNDVQDHLKLIDLPGNNGGSGALQKGWISAKNLNHLAFGSLILAALLGLPAILAYPRLLVLALVIAAIGVIGYSNRPFNFKYRALGDVAVFVLCGPLLTYCYSVAAFGRIDSGTHVLGIAFGLAAVGILHANNLQDIPIDRLRGAKTVANTISFAIAKRGLLFLYGATYLVLGGAAALSVIPIWVVVASLLSAPVALKLARNSIQASGPESPLLSGIRVKTAQTHLLLGLSICVGLGVAIALR